MVTVRRAGKGSITMINVLSGPSRLVYIMAGTSCDLILGKSKTFCSLFMFVVLEL